MLFIWNRLFLRKNKFPADIRQIIFIGYVQTDVMELRSKENLIGHEKHFSLCYSQVNRLVTSVDNNP